jgi:MoxR-like ATPase
MSLLSGFKRRAISLPTVSPACTRDCGLILAAIAILTGLSGSGKTLLAREYALALSRDGAEHRLLTVPVQPGWYDPGALLGFPNPLRGESYVRTDFLEYLIAAVADPTRPYVAVLDEMNLSHPEQYMASLLSAMETGEAIRLHAEGDFFDGVPGAIEYPRNLVLIGTVNMDETTHGLSDKVLDRAFVLEFWEIDLAAYPRWGSRAINPADESRARDVLIGLMLALSPARLHFGWRVVDDVLDFLREAASAADVLPFETALDGVIYAKVLPKLRGEDAPRLRDALKRCEETLAKFGLPLSQAKVAELRRDLETTGSARFWR